MQPVHVLHLLLLKPIMLMLFGDVFQKIGIKPVTFGAPWQTKCRWMLEGPRGTHKHAAKMWQGKELAADQLSFQGEAESESTDMEIAEASAEEEMLWETFDRRVFL